MGSYPSFGVLLTRLLDHRRLDVSGLSAASGIPEADLGSLLSGVPPLAWQIDALAPVLGIRAADLYVIADVHVPPALAPRDPAAGSSAVSLVQITMALPPGQRAHVRRLVEQVPEDAQGSPPALPQAYDQREAGFGAMLSNLLCGNRNLRSLTDAARVLALLTGGRLYLAATTISGIGRGRVPLTPDRVAGFAVTLGIPVSDLAVVVGVEPVEPPFPEDPLTAEMASLLWDCRRLAAAQVEHVHDEAKAMLVPVPDNAPSEAWNLVYHHHGTWWGAKKG
jgi:hypothetical protein